jgi:16S rRNA (cytosine967-C5)-methyltransferase
MHAQSLPAWIAARWLELFGPAEAAALAAACTEMPPLTVRVNPHQADLPGLLDELRAHFPTHARVAMRSTARCWAGAVRPPRCRASSRATSRCRTSVAARGRPARSAAGRARARHVRGAGGKATAIAERVGMKGSVLALDRHPGRLDLVRRAARRLQLGRLECRAFDASLDLAEVTPDGGFDRVLVDAPCSGLGSLRRNPDARWRVRAGDPARLADLQRNLLLRASRAVRPGGVLVYSTCTVLPEENEAVVEAFLRESPQFVPAAKTPDEVGELVDARSQLHCWPHRHDTDGFFAARLERRS